MTLQDTDVQASRIRKVAEVIRFVQARRLSFLSEGLLVSLARVALANEERGVSGRIIEAGVALGGSSLVLTAAKAQHRPISFFDTFGVIPAPGKKDGEDVHARYKVIADGNAEGHDGDQYYGYRDGLMESLIRNLREADLDPATNLVSLHAGDLRQTMTSHESLSLVHVDCDWYDPVLHCLTSCAPSMSIGGRFIVDDYSSWSGARRATDEWFSTQSAFTLRLQDGRAHIIREGRDA